MESCKEAEREVYKVKEVPKELEYNRLRTLIPGLAEKHCVSKIEVVEEAISYIAQLQQRLSNFNEVTSEELQQQFLQREQRRRLLIREKTRKIPSYQQRNKRRRPSTMQSYKYKTNKK